MYRIELRPHKAIDRVGNEVEHNQWMIYANGLHIGYVGYDAGAPINLTGAVSKSAERTIRKAICEELREVRPLAVPPTDAEVQYHEKKKRGK